MLRVEPVMRLSMAMTVWPSARKRSHKCEPKNPAPPVIRTLITFSPCLAYAFPQVQRCGPVRQRKYTSLRQSVNQVLVMTHISSDSRTCSGLRRNELRTLPT